LYSDDDKSIEELEKEIEELKKQEGMLRQEEERLRKEEDELEKEEEGIKVEAEGIKKTTIEEKEVELEESMTYLLIEENPEKSIKVKLYLKEKQKGIPGLYITRSNPQHVKKKYGLDDTTEICWLTSVKATGEITSISGLQELSILISNYVDKNNKSIILLDGLEYLISNNDFAIVLRLIQQTRDRISTSESIMLVPFNPNALDQKQFTLLERECTILD